MKVSKSIRDLYVSLSDKIAPVELQARQLLEDYCKQQRWEFHFRRKEEVSFAQKLETGMYRKFSDIDDFLGCEIIVSNLREIPTAQNFIRDNFEIISEKPNFTQDSSQFSFDGVRMYVKIKPSSTKPDNSQDMQFEIQIKTLLELAWGNATHDFTYKCKEVQWAKERLVYQMRALLAHADLVLADIEALSQNPLLNRSYARYDKINEISGWVQSKWEEVDCPENMKRLSETLEKLCSTYSIDFEDLKNLTETFMHENVSTKNLSVYSTILQALFNSNHPNFISVIKNTDPPQKKELRLVIPDEIEIEESLKNDLNPKRCIFVKSYLPT